MSKVLGSNEWGPNSAMYYKTPMEAKVSNTYSTHPKRLTTPMHEAKGLVVWQNNFEKWQKLHAWTKMTENQGKTQPIYGGKWTDTETGQSEFTSWHQDGLDAYNATKKAVKMAWDAKHMDKIHRLETKMLAHLRQKHGISCSNHADEQKLKKKNKRQAKNNLEMVEAKKQRVSKTFDDDDDAFIE